MLLRISVLGAALALTALSQPVSPPAEPSALIEEIRSNALAYDKNLPNFICTQETRRSSVTNKPGDENWKVRDTLTIRLSYFGRKEDYRVIQVNGKPTDKGMDKVGGWKTIGDFGSIMRAVFAVKSQASFELGPSETWNGRPVAVLKYRIAPEHSNFNSSTGGVLHTNRSVFGAEGTVYADADTKQVLRLTVNSTGFPDGFPVREVHITTEYAKQKIGDGEYLLPARTVSVTVTKGDRKKGETQFSDYRMFSADTSIKFGEPTTETSPAGKKL
jgi:hypothetical protein